VAVAAVLIGCVLSAVAADPGLPQTAAPRQLRLHLVLRQGWIGVSLTAPAGARIAILETLGKRSRLLARLTAGTRGVSVGHVAAWSCDRRTRVITAELIDVPYARIVRQRVRTPSCAHRLAVQASSLARPGRRFAVVVRDTWGVGDLRFSLCVRPPAYRERCRPEGLRRGVSRLRVEHLAASPGRWVVMAGTRFGQRLVRDITVAHVGGRLRLLATGDSEIQLIDQFLAADLARRWGDVTSDARIGTGISKLQLFDWIGHAWVQAGSMQPDITVMFIGGNDGFAIQSRTGSWVVCCGRRWSELLADRVDEMMRAYLRGGAGRVYWFTLPAPRDPRLAASFAGVNVAYRIAAARHPDGVHVMRADRVFTPNGYFQQTIDYHGHQISVREADGYHLNAAGDQIATSMLIDAMRGDGLIG
jgi:hypothetical protein